MYLKWPPLGSVIYLQAVALQADLRSAPAILAEKPGQQRSCETTTARHQNSTGPSRSALLSPAHPARSSVLPPKVRAFLPARDHRWPQNLKRARLRRHLHAPEQPGRSADRIPRNSGRGWPVDRATRPGTGCGHHARGSRPCPWCRTICRLAILRCGGRSRQATGWDGIGQTGTCRLLSALIGTSP